MSPLDISLILFGGMFILLALGLPLAFTMGGMAILASVFFWNVSAFYLFITKIWEIVNNFSLVALPLFVFMAAILQDSGIADNLYKTIHKWMGPIRGGLAAGTVIIAAIFAAMSGLSATATISLGVIALPNMLKQGYDKRMAMGCIQAGGALGILIPPSVMFIVFGMIAEVSIGKLFMGGLFPGILLTSFFIIYIMIRSYLNPAMAPALPLEERASMKEKIDSLVSVLPPIVIIIMVLGSIYFGIASVTESAAIGVLGTFLVTVTSRRLKWAVLRNSFTSSFKLTAMVVWILLGSSCFAAVYQALGASDFVQSMMLSVPGGRWGVFILMQLTFFILGCMLDPSGIIMITAPIYLPLIKQLGFDPVWYGVMFTMNMEMAYLTPPFGFNLFYMKSIVPKGITMTDIYRSVVPYISLQALGLIVCSIFPQIVLWLPERMIGR